MIFFLKNVNNGDVFYLTGKHQFLVGRKDCDLLIQDDQSISRKHAIIHINENQVTVEDCGSKYKTEYKGEKMKPNVKVTLEIGENIQFGVTHSLYSLEKFEFVTTGTRLSSSLKAKLASDLSTIGGRYVEQWTSDCTHLTVEEITLTIKFLHALIDEKPIVKPAYWTKFAERVQKNLPPPDINQYNKPPVAEVLLNKVDLSPNAKRKSLYKGKLFVFPKEQDKKQMEDVIRKAGGTSISWEKDPLPLEDMKKSPKEFIIIQTRESNNNSSLNDVIKAFAKQGKRTIPLQEIATSILLCSCDRDCNPNFNKIEEVFPSSGPNEPTQNSALVANTESQCFSVKEMKIAGPQTIPDTFESELGESEACKMFPPSCVVSEKETHNSQSVKRLNSANVDEAPTKKIKIHKECESTVNKKKIDTFLTKQITPKMREIREEPPKQNENKNETPFNISKRNRTDGKSENNNPFKIMKKESNTTQISKDNPFKLSLGSKKRSNDDQGESSVHKKKKNNTDDARIFSRTSMENVSRNISGFSGISRVNKDIINSTWMSKNSSNVVTKSEDDMDSYFNIDIKEFIEQFKNTVVVEIMDKIPAKPKILRDYLDGCENGKVNFKRFKKVMPLKPQTKVIEKVNLTVVDGGDTAGIVDNRKELHHSDDEQDNIKVKKKMPKRFII